MCGILGYVGPAGNAEIVDAMLATIVHRGPNEGGRHVAGEIGIGIRRLSIIDVTGGQQPISDRDQFVTVVFNGEIYNHESLRTALENAGHVFSTHADTEVLIHGYKEWGGPGLLERLNGMFAFAIHDQRSDEVFIARDRVGIKPLYYTKSADTFYFTSEVKAFKAVDEIEFAVNKAALPDYLRLRYVPAPETIFKDVYKLPAGHFMTVTSDAQYEVTQYWHPTRETGPLCANVEETFADLFEDATRIRMMSEVPLGAYLSAGIDSTMVVSTMAKTASERVTTYSFGVEGSHDEASGAARTAAKIGVENHRVEFEDKSFDDLARIIWHLDEPIGDAHILPTFALAERASDKLTVVLLGEGADESLYGYPFYKVSFWARRLLSVFPGFVRKRLIPELIKRTPLAVLNLVFPLPSSLGTDGRRHLADFFKVVADGEGAAVFQHLSGLFTTAEIRRLMPHVNEARKFTPPHYFPPAPEGSAPAETLLLEINAEQFRGWLQDNILLRHDKLSMAHSVECRVPFLDHRVIEFLASLPRRFKISGWREKCIARDYVAKNIDPEISKAPKKPFYMPLEQFVASSAFSDLVNENLSEERLRRRGYFDPAEVKALIKAARGDNFLAVKRVMSLIILELWHRIFIDDEYSFYQKATPDPRN